MEWYSGKLTLHIPHYMWDGELKPVDYEAFTEILINELGKLGVCSFYSTQATGYYKGRKYAEDLFTVFCDKICADYVKDAVCGIFREHNDIMKQEAFAYEYNGKLIVRELEK